MGNEKVEDRPGCAYQLAGSLLSEDGDEGLQLGAIALGGILVASLVRDGRGRICRGSGHDEMMRSLGMDKLVVGQRDRRRELGARLEIIAGLDGLRIEGRGTR